MTESDDAPWSALYRTVKRLRAPDGCPWDREQTPESLVPFLLEEAHEAAEAIRAGHRTAAAEELGDLLLNVMLQTAIAEERGEFSLDDVLDRVRQKIVRRHPHVFGDETDADLETIRRNWKRIKAEEKPESQDDSVLRKLPASLPALERAERIGRDAARVGFDWPDWRGAWAKVLEEVSELGEALDHGTPEPIEHELGDLLFAIASLARHRALASEESLRRALDRFRARFRRVEASVADLDSATLDELEAAWVRAKRGDPPPPSAP